jgi:hypothetical protein
MASVRSLDGVLDLEPRSLGARRFLKTLTIYWNAFGEGAAAAHEYATLTRRGTPHEEAVQRMFEEHFDRR